MYNVEQLRAAILRRAIADYKIALKKQNLSAISKLERFFLSGWGQLLSYNHGEYIIDNCKRIVRNNRKFKKHIEK